MKVIEATRDAKNTFLLSLLSSPFLTNLLTAFDREIPSFSAHSSTLLISFGGNFAEMVFRSLIPVYFGIPRDKTGGNRNVSGDKLK